jgi:hypothetical protein
VMRDLPPLSRHLANAFSCSVITYWEKVKMNHTGLLDYDAAYQALEHLTVARAVYYLTYIFDCGEHEIYVNGQSQTPIDAARNHVGWMSNRVGIWFWGGPPDNEDWFEGTILTMLMDKLFYSVAMGYDNLINKFLETLNSGKNKTPHS